MTGVCSVKCGDVYAGLQAQWAAAVSLIHVVFVIIFLVHSSQAISRFITTASIMIINTIINITLIREVIKVEIKECKGMDGV